MPIQSIAIDALLALSVWATFGTGRLALAGPGFMACGAYAAALAGPHVRESFWLCAVTSAAVGYSLGLVIDRCVNRLAATSYSIATLSFSLAAPALMQSIFVTRASAHAAGNIFSALVCLVAGVLALSVTSDRQRFAAGAAAAGIAGAVYWSTGGSLAASAFGLDRLGVMVAVALLGGAASPLAPVLSASLLALLAKIAAPLTDQPLIVDGGVLLLALVYLPDGAWSPLASALRAIARAPRESTDGSS